MHNQVLTIIKLIDFIRTGKFGPVELGMDKKKIISYLGEAEKGYKSSIWYGSYEFFFQEKSQILSGLQNDHLFDYYGRDDNAAFFQNNKFKIDPWILGSDKNVTYKECIACLLKEKINFEEKFEFSNYKIKIESGVYFSFDNYDGVWTLDNKTAEKSNIIIKEKDNYILEGIRLYDVHF